MRTQNNKQKEFKLSTSKLKSKSKFKDNKIYKRQSKKEKNQNLNFFKEAFSLLLRLRDSTLK